jgi:hypothetical protein
MDANDELAERVRLAGGHVSTPINPDLLGADERVEEPEIDNEAAEAEQAARVRRRRDMLQQELEIAAIE